MQRYLLTLACRNYDRTSAIIRGAVTPQGVDLQIREMTNVGEMFAGMFNGKYDVSELSLAEFIYSVSRGQNDFLGVPVFPSRVFRHSSIYVNTAADVKSPRDVSGKRVAFPHFVQTACIWQRGILIDEYDVSAKDTEWFYGLFHHQGSGEEQEAVTAPDGSTVHRLQSAGGATYETAEAALLEGEVDVLGNTGIPIFTKTGDQRARRLFENYQDEEASYFEKTRIFPIMHVLAVRKAVVEEHPDLPEQLFDTFVEAKRLGNEWVQTLDLSVGIIWKNYYLHREREIFQGDPFAYGLEQNRHVLEKFLSYCHAQGVSEREMRPEELFFPSTWALAE